MDAEIYNFLIIGSVVIYISVTTLYSKEFYRITHNPLRAKLHLRIAIAVSLLGALKIAFSPHILIGDLYFFVPLLYLCLIKIADSWTLKKYDRHLIVAHRYNMSDESTKDAKFSDYAFFMFVNFGSLIFPMFVYESILGLGSF